MEDRWLSASEMAIYWGVTPDSVYRWIDSKGMPGHTADRKLSREEIDDWVESSGANDREQNELETELG